MQSKENVVEFRSDDINNAQWLAMLHDMIDLVVDNDAHDQACIDFMTDWVEEQTKELLPDKEKLIAHYRRYNPGGY